MHCGGTPAWKIIDIVSPKGNHWRKVTVYCHADTPFLPFYGSLGWKRMGFITFLMKVMET